MYARTASEAPVLADARTRSLLVSEIFGPTFQGEGPSLGRRCAFLRLGACNLQCRWCDTPYTWDWLGRNGRSFDPQRELSRLDPTTVWASLLELGVDSLVISGGEPILQQRQLVPLVGWASDAGWWIEIETAGTIAPGVDLLRYVSRINVSPKLANSGNARGQRYRPQVLDALQASGKAVWKFVAQGPADLDEVGELVDRHALAPVYVMPEGTHPELVIRRGQALADAVLARGWNLTTRLHILLYGDRRGI